MQTACTGPACITARDLMPVADQTTFVKLDRNIKDWRWFKNRNVLQVWIWLLVSVNIKPHDFENETIQPGEVATSRKTIAAATGLTERQVRSAIDALKKTGEVSVRIRARYQVITILRWASYQSIMSGKMSGKMSGSSPADVRLESGSGPQSKNGKNVRRERKKDIFSAPTVDQVLAFAKSEQLPMSQKDAEQFVWFNESRGWKGTTDWHALVRMRASQLGDGAADPEETEERREI